MHPRLRLPSAATFAAACVLAATATSTAPWIVEAGVSCRRTCRPGPTSLAAQTTIAEATATPESTAELYLRSVRAIRWRTAAQFIDDRTLARFDTTVTLMSDADTTGAVRRFFTGEDSVGLARLDPADVFGRAVGATIDGMPGLMHSLYDRDDEVLGHVPEGADDAHVVYRTTARLSGAVPEVKVIQMRRSGAGWRVLWSDELEVIDAALRGVPRRMR